MKNVYIVQLLNRLRSSYWFIPAIMGLSAIVLSFGTTYLDMHLGMTWSDELLGVFSNRPEGARAFLSTVASSMITVAGVTFSLTILAVSHASSQYGPRILTNFMRDSSNQITLGTFIATFLYCLLVLRTVRGHSEVVGDATDTVGAFVPHVSIAVALLLALFSIAVLINFFHHIPESIRLSNVVEDVGRRLLEKIGELFPEAVGAELDSKALPFAPSGISTIIANEQNGYIQAIDGDRLIRNAEKYDVVIELEKRPGDFVSEGTSLFRIWSANSTLRIDDLAEDIRDCYAWGNCRTFQQDIMFLVDELVEVAARALSAGVNDPFTAMNCIDWLESGLFALSERETPHSYRRDESGSLRVVAPALGFTDICKMTGNKLRPYFSSDRNAALYYLNSLGILAAKVRRDDQRHCVRDLAESLIDMCSANGMFAADLSELRRLKGELFAPYDESRRYGTGRRV